MPYGLLLTGEFVLKSAPQLGYIGLQTIGPLIHRNRETRHVLRFGPLWYVVAMSKRFITRLKPEQVRALEEISRAHGGVKISEVIRLAIAEYIASESKRMRAARQPLYGQAVGRPLWMGPEHERRA
jgi:hypothetical protein